MPVQGWSYGEQQTPQPIPTQQPPQPTGGVRGWGYGTAPQTNPILGQIGHVASQIATPIGKLLDVQRYGVARLLTGKENTDDQMTAMRHAVPGLDQLYEASGKVPGIGHFLQGTEDTAIQTLSDPLTYETAGAGPLLKGLGIAGKVGPTAVRALTATPLGRVMYDFLNWGGKVKRTLGPEIGQTVRGAANMASSTGSIVQRDLLRRFDEVEKGLSPQEKVRVGQALNGKIPHELPFSPENPESLNPNEQKAYQTLRQLTEEDYAHRLDTARTVALRAYTQDLSAQDRSIIEQALRDGKEPTIPEPSKLVRVEDPQATDIYERSRAVNAPRGTVPEPSAPRYTFQPGNAQEIIHATILRDRYNKIARFIEEKVPKREHYMPWAHEPGPEGREGFIADITDYHDPRAQEREDVHVTTPDQLRRGFEAMASNTNRQVTTRLIHESLGDLLDNPDIKDLFKKTIKATGGARTDMEKIKDAWLGLVGYPRAAIVSLTPRHGGNILDLLVNTVPPQYAPQVLKDTMDLTRRLVQAAVTGHPEEYDRLTQEGRQLGAISGSFTERKPFFQNVPVLKNWTQLNNTLTWAIDEAAKQTYAKLLVKTGEAKGLQAGGLASQRLVDYEHLAPIQQMLRYIAPFGTFRGGIPGAVVGGIARNPARAAFLNRATGGTMYGGAPAPGQHGTTLYNPTADVSRGIGAPQEYLRATLGAPVQAAATLAEEALSGHPGASIQNIGQELQDLPKTLAAAPGQVAQHQMPDILPRPRKASSYADAVALRAARYLNYGNPVDLRWLTSAAAAGVPEARTILDQVNAGQFRPRPGTPAERFTKEAILQSLGIGIR